MSTNLVYKDMLRDLIGPGVRAHGFTGTSPRWMKRYPNGDMLIVRFQASRSSTRTEVLVTAHYDFVTAGKLEYLRERAEALSGPSSKTPDIGPTDGILRGGFGRPRSARADSSGYWWAVSDERDAQLAADDLLPQVASLVARCDEYVHDRAALLEAIPVGASLGLASAAFVLAERGPSSELDDCLEKYLADLASRVRPHAERTAAWIQAFADRSSASPA